MNKSFLYLIIIILTTLPIFSQDNPPCTDCWNVPWSIKTEIIPFNIQGCPNCTIWVEYWYRKIQDSCRDHAAFIGTKDLQIKDVWGTQGCNLCFSVQEMFNIAKDSLLLNNIFTTKQRPSFDTLWRVFQTSCWGEWWDVFDQKYKIRGCLPNNICCWELYGIYSTNNIVDSVKKIKTFMQSPMWDGCDKWTTPCWFVCDTAYFPPPPPNLSSKQGYNSNFYTKLTPNPNKGIFELEFINSIEEFQEISIRFHNIDGELIYALEDIKPQKGNKIKVHLEKCYPGLYYYKVTTNNKVIDNGNFVLTK